LIGGHLTDDDHMSWEALGVFLRQQRPWRVDGKTHNRGMHGCCCRGILPQRNIWGWETIEEHEPPNPSTGSNTRYHHPLEGKDNSNIKKTAANQINAVITGPGGGSRWGLVWRWVTGTRGVFKHTSTTPWKTNDTDNFVTLLLLCVLACIYKIGAREGEIVTKLILFGGKKTEREGWMNLFWYSGRVST